MQSSAVRRYKFRYFFFWAYASANRAGSRGWLQSRILAVHSCRTRVQTSKTGSSVGLVCAIASDLQVCTALRSSVSYVHTYKRSCLWKFPKLFCNTNLLLVLRRLALCRNEAYFVESRASSNLLSHYSLIVDFSYELCEVSCSEIVRVRLTAIISLGMAF